jgi:hypothetical protein
VKNNDDKDDNQDHVDKKCNEWGKNMDEKIRGFHNFSELISVFLCLYLS